MAGKFKDINGSIVCKELLGLVPMGSGAATAAESPEPSDRTTDYYKKRPCEELVGISARIVGEKLLTLSIFTKFARIKLFRWITKTLTKLILGTESA
jgi:hypothetical protein